MNNFTNLHHSWRAFWGLSALFCALTILPFLTSDYPGLADYANHLARLHILTDQAQHNWHQFYSVYHAFIPNLALDTIGSFFVHLGLTPELSLRLFSALTVLVVVAGIYAIALTVNKEPPWLAMWVFILIFNRYFSWGFLNYFFSLGLGFLILSFWIFVRNHNNATLKYLSQFAISVLLIFTLLSHLMGYGITILSIFMYELGKAVSKNYSWSKILKHLSCIFLAFIPSILFYLFVCAHGDSGLNIQYYDILKSKAAGVLTPFASYNTKYALFYFVSFIVTLYIALVNPFKLKQNAKGFINDIFPTFTFLIPLTLLLLYLALPSAMMGSAFLDKRIFIVVLLFTISLIVIKFNAKSALTIIVISLLTLMVKVYEVNHVWTAHSEAMQNISQAFDNVEIGSKVVGYSFGDSNRLPVPPLQHAASLAIIQRGAFVPSLFAKPINLESVIIKPPFDKLAYKKPTSTFRFDSPQSIWTDKGDTCALYDYTLVTYMSKKPVVPECFKKVTSGKYFTLYKMHP